MGFWGGGGGGGWVGGLVVMISELNPAPKVPNCDVNRIILMLCYTVMYFDINTCFTCDDRRITIASWNMRLVMRE